MFFAILLDPVHTPNFSRAPESVLYIQIKIHWRHSSSCTLINTGNSMISSDIWHKYHELYFKIVILRNFTRLTAREI